MKIYITERQYSLIMEQSDSRMPFQPETMGYKQGNPGTIKGAVQNQQKLPNETRKVIENLSTLSVDDLVDLASAAIDGVPGIGNLISAGIDISHAISYIVRFYYSKNEDEKIQNLALSFVTIGSTFMPVAGNSLNIVARQGIKGVLKKTPQEILVIAKKYGLYNDTVFLMRKEKWKWNFLLFLAKTLKGKLGEFLAYISSKLTEIYNKIRTVVALKDANIALLALINEIKDMNNLSATAIRLEQTREIL